MTQENPLFAGFQPQPIGDQQQAQQPIEQKPPKPPRKTRAAAKAVAKPRKPKKAATAPQAPKLPAHTVPKFDLQTAFAAMRELKEDDIKPFEIVLGAFNGCNKEQRARIIAALGKVFT